MAFLGDPVVLAEGSGHIGRGANLASEVVALFASGRPANETNVLPHPRGGAR
jgi:hypothetical protein